MSFERAKSGGEGLGELVEMQHRILEQMRGTNTGLQRKHRQTQAELETVRRELAESKKRQQELVTRGALGTESSYDDYDDDDDDDVIGDVIDNGDDNDTEPGSHCVCLCVCVCVRGRAGEREGGRQTHARTHIRVCALAWTRKHTYTYTRSLACIIHECRR